MRFAGALLIAALLGVGGCVVDVATLSIAAPDRPPAAALQRATSLGWRDGESCRLWIVGVPLGLPQVDEAMRAALEPVGGAFLRDATVYSVHPTYGLFGWHCYQVHGEAYG